MVDCFSDILAGGRFAVLRDSQFEVLADARFERYFELLVRRNAEFNLTTILEREDVWVKHFADSLAALPFVAHGAEVLDVGSGAGFPGLPLKLARGDIGLTLVESIKKKAGFLREVCDVLGLGGMEVLNCRAEDLPRGKLYDCGVARAVAKTATLCEYILPFIKVGGVMIAYKAKDAEQEAKEAEHAIAVLGGKLEEVRRIDLGENERNLIVIRKVKDTPTKYPRGGNKARLAPL